MVMTAEPFWASDTLQAVPGQDSEAAVSPNLNVVPCISWRAWRRPPESFATLLCCRGSRAAWHSCCADPATVPTCRKPQAIP